MANICFSCMRWHDGPNCGWNGELRCVGCGLARGYRWTDDAGEPGTPTSLCWRCAQPGLIAA